MKKITPPRPLKDAKLSDLLTELEFRRDELSGILDSFHNPATIVEQAVCNALGCSLSAIHSDSRKAAYVVPRHLSMILMRETGMIYEDIAKHFNRHHSAIFNAERRIEDLCKTDPAFGRKVDALRTAVRSKLRGKKKP